MSELETYLLVTLGSTICGFFIGMGNAIVLSDDLPEKQRNKQPESHIPFPFAALVGSGYVVAWLWVSYQPMFKLIPVFALATMAGVFGGQLTKDGIGPLLPMVGVVLMPTMFHVSRYFGLV